MKKILWSLALGFLAKKMNSGMHGQQQGDCMATMRLKASLIYVKSIGTFRMLFLSLLGIGVCLTFLGISLIIFPTVMFLYAPWTVETKILAGLLFGAVYLLIAVVSFSSVFSEEKWLKIFNADKILEELSKQEASLQNPRPEASNI